MFPERVKSTVDYEFDRKQILLWKEARLKSIRENVMKSCRGCNSSGSNIMWCADCSGSYCSNCKTESGVNVCPLCRSYSGTSVPFAVSQLRDPSKDQYTKVGISLPGWYKDL